MSGRSVPHAHPATTEYEFANPSRLGEQRFGEGRAQWTPLGPHPHLLNSGQTSLAGWPGLSPTYGLNCTPGQPGSYPRLPALGPLAMKPWELPPSHPPRGAWRALTHPTIPSFPLPSFSPRSDLFSPAPSLILPSVFSAPFFAHPGLLPEDILTPTLYHGYYVRPRAAQAGEGSRAGVSELRLSEGKFQAFLDVSHFTPDEVTVRTVDNLLEVSARHPQRLDRHGFVSREFCRTYVLPADVDPWRLRAALSHDGVLHLEAPRGSRHSDTEINEVHISLLPAPPDPKEEEEEAGMEP